MNYNNSYVDNNIHDRRKVNNAKGKEKESWNSMNYVKNNSMNVTTRPSTENMMGYRGYTDVSTNENGMENTGSDRALGVGRNIHINPIYDQGNNNIHAENTKMSGSMSGNLKSSNKFGNNFINPNDRNNANVPSAISSNYVGAHPTWSGRREGAFMNTGEGNAHYAFNERNSNYVIGGFHHGGKETKYNSGGISSMDPTFHINNNTLSQENRQDLVYAQHGITNKEMSVLDNRLNFTNNNLYNQHDMNNRMVIPNQPFKSENNGMVNSSNSASSRNFMQTQIWGNIAEAISGIDGYSATGSTEVGKEGKETKEANKGKGIIHNIFESLTSNAETNDEINKLVKQRVTNLVMNEIGKKIETHDSSFIGNKLQLLRGYFDVTHSYVVNKIFFILFPYMYIRKALCESRTYYVYSHLERKMSSANHGENCMSPFSLNHTSNIQSFAHGHQNMNNMMKGVQQAQPFMQNKNLFFDSARGGAAGPGGFHTGNMRTEGLSGNIETHGVSGNMGTRGVSGNMETHGFSGNMGTHGVSGNMGTSDQSGTIGRNNSNDINYVNYNNNMGIFKADLYIPLMSSITYILLYTLTITAQKNNFVFKPDNLFNISSYVFLLLFFETVIIKFCFLLTCRDINLSFLHILSFISYKFVIMCALIITKFLFYLLYLMYTSVYGDPENILEKQDLNKKIVMNNNSHNIFKSMSPTFSSNFTPYNIILFLNGRTMYRLTQMYFYPTVSIQMIQLFKSIHLYVHDNSSLSNHLNIKRINILILIFSLLQIFLCWILTPYFA
ncbi:hypothetical protein, conserved [Plasmodium gonderi]|uniref:C-13 antigen n=1 Tax=Plasmodium gonderi TaxID=77519 RepID=A0A1Y1JBT1_PLAGO|nr:hypothetical protein, conserved [Plasmodium gonderi]GAW79700.1 hypothetical protein, conserved [Plasmodium gonderi]